MRLVACVGRFFDVFISQAGPYLPPKRFLVSLKFVDCIVDFQDRRLGTSRPAKTYSWPKVTSNQDLEYLKLLSIFHYVAAGLTAVFALLPIFHLAIGIAIVSGAFDDQSGEAPPEFFGWMFIIIPGMMMAIGWTFAILIAIAGRKLSRRTSYTFCLVIAGIECLMMPYGTILGVFTIIVLMRPSVKELFGVAVEPDELA